MASNSGISWTYRTLNPWSGCTKVAPECANCYAVNVAGRMGVKWGPSAVRKLTKTARANLATWQAQAVRSGLQAVVFVASLSDVFEDRPELNEPRQNLWDAMPDASAMDYFLLTKRPQNILRMVPEAWLAAWPANVWVGTTVGHHSSLGKIDQLLAVPAATRILSVEPLLEELDLRPWLSLRNPDGTPAITWVIVGGESGGGARPMHPDWARRVRDACQDYGVLFHFKQHGEWLHQSQLEGAGLDLTSCAARPTHLWPDGTISYRVNKKVAGNVLDGVLHLEIANPRGVRRPIKGDNDE